MDSIWACKKSSDEFQNTFTRYSIRPEQLIENATEKLENYDLMSVVAICLGKLDSENYTGILKFLDVLLSSSRATTEKILEEEFGIAMSEELEKSAYYVSVSYTHLRAHETDSYLVCRLLLEKKKT